MALPALRLISSEDQAYVALRIDPKFVVTEEQILESVSQERARLPFLAAHPDPPAGWLFSMLGREMLDTYNKQLEGYFREFENCIRNAAKVGNWRRLTPLLSLAVVNDGGAPANEVEVEVHLPDGFDVLEEKQLKEWPAKPKPPLTPEQMLKQQFSMPALDMSGLRALNPSAYVRDAVSGPRISEIKKVNSYLVSFKLGNVKHTKSVELPKIYLHFDSDEDAKPFKLRYSILAANLRNHFWEREM